MRWPGGKGKIAGVPVWGVLIVALVIVVAGAAYLLVQEPYLSDPAEARAALQRASRKLAGSGARVALTVDVVQSEEEHFSASGSADFESARAALTYDFEALINAAGGFGHLDEFDVVVESETTYVDIFTEEPSWVSFDEPARLAYTDVGRLREVVLSAPLAVPGLLGAMTDVSATAHGFFADSATVTGVVLAVATENAPGMEAFLELATELEVRSIDTEAEVSGGEVRSLTYGFDFLRAPGLVDRVSVRVTVEIDPAEVDEIEPPSEGQVRPFKEFLVS